MSAAILTHIYCDGCGVTYGVDMSHRTATEHRQQMREEGWLYSGNKDYCPDCRSKTKAGKNHKSINRKKSKNAEKI